MQKNSFNYEELIACGKGELFGEGNAKLPLPPMLMFDRITEIKNDTGEFKKGFIKAELDIKDNLWFFDCHFQNDPVMPGCLGLDALWQLTGFYLTWLGGTGKGRALGCGEVKFKGQIRPHHKLIKYKIDIKKIITKPIWMGMTDATLEVSNKTIYFAKNLQVGLFDNLKYPPSKGEEEPF